MTNTAHNKWFAAIGGRRELSRLHDHADGILRTCCGKPRTLSTIAILMALIFLGKSVCPICGQTLQEGDEIITIPPITNTQLELYSYFDQGTHLTCFENWDKKEDVTKILDKELKTFKEHLISDPC